jgi:hypothetical protein
MTDKFWQAINLKNNTRTFNTKQGAINHIQKHMTSGDEYIITEATDVVRFVQQPVEIVPIGWESIFPSEVAKEPEKPVDPEPTPKFSLDF